MNDYRTVPPARLVAGSPEPWQLTSWQYYDNCRSVFTNAREDAIALVAHQLDSGITALTQDTLDNLIRWDFRHGSSTETFDRLKWDENDGWLPVSFLKVRQRKGVDARVIQFNIRDDSKILDATECWTHNGGWLTEPWWYPGLIQWVRDSGLLGKRHLYGGSQTWPAVDDVSDWTFDSWIPDDKARVIPMLAMWAKENGYQLLRDTLITHLVLDPAALELSNVWTSHAVQTTHRSLVDEAVENGLFVSPEVKASLGISMVGDTILRDSRLAAIRKSTATLRRLVFDLRQRDRTVAQDTELDVLTIAACRRLLQSVYGLGVCCGYYQRDILVSLTCPPLPTFKQVSSFSRSSDLTKQFEKVEHWLSNLESQALEGIDDSEHFYMSAADSVTGIADLMAAAGWIEGARAFKKGVF